MRRGLFLLAEFEYFDGQKITPTFLVEAL